MHGDKQRRSGRDMSIITACMGVIAEATSTVARLLCKALLYVVAILLAISRPWVGGPLLLCLMFWL